MQLILRAKFTKKNYLKYISHLDTMRLLQRTFRIADIPIKYSEGFNPHPKFSIGSALSLGISSEGEYMDIELEEKMPAEEFIERMNKALPDNMRIVKGKYVDGSSSISSIISWGFYNISFELENALTHEKVQSEIKKLLSLDEIIVKKEKRKKGRIYEKEDNIRGQIGNLNFKDLKARKVEIEALLKTGDSGNLKPIDFLKALEKYTDIRIIYDTVKIHRIELYSEKDNKIESPLV